LSRKGVPEASIANEVWHTEIELGLNALVGHQSESIKYLVRRASCLLLDPIALGRHQIDWLRQFHSIEEKRC
jgi:hypothetical protein